MISRAALAAMMVFGTALPASAATLAFSYTYAGNGNILSGTASGTLAADGNRFVTNQLTALAVNGVSVGTNYRVTGFDYTNATIPATLSLDGSYLDFDLSTIAYNSSMQPIGFTLHFVAQVGTPYAADVAAAYPQFPSGVAAGDASLGGMGTQGYVRANYAASLVQNAVPEPTTWGMMILGFGVIGVTMRRRAKARTAVSFG